jgi:predicted nucleic acid-binding protein
VILIDTSVWADHLRTGNARLGGLLDSGGVLGHPFVSGELALGNLRQRGFVLSALRDLPQATVATDEGVCSTSLIAERCLGSASGMWMPIC